MTKRWRYGLVAVGSVLAVALFVGLSAQNAGPGFPLDDAWIHQTYARNFARNGRFEFIPGIISSGSTSPLWTILLAIGYMLRLPYMPWSNMLGVLSLWLLAWAGMRLWRQIWPDFADRDWLIGLVLVLTWPLVWAASSGMETLLFAALGLAIVSKFAREQGGKQQKSDTQSPINNLKSLSILGFLSGLLILTRPDGLLLLLLLAAGLGLDVGRLGMRVKRVSVFIGTAVLPLLPYFAFNMWVNGSVWPNTFAAKQTEYATLLAEPLLGRFTRLLFFSLGGPESGWQGMSGAHLLLVPGLITAVWLALQSDWREQRLFHVLPVLWAGGHIALYAWRLPVTYQHGRYIMTAVPVWVLYGLAGWQWLLTRIGANRAGFLMRQVARLVFISLLLIFLLLGAQSYVQDVAFIEGEMVTAAHWLAENTPPDALIAAHDIGAIGYFAEQPLLDLAGLITPDIVPYLDDEARMAQYVLDSHAVYLVTAPGWPYLQITEADFAKLSFNANFAWTRENGLNNTAVYQLNLP